MTEGTRQLGECLLSEEGQDEFPCYSVDIVKKFRCDIKTTCDNCIGNPMETIHVLIGENDPNSVIDVCSRLYEEIMDEGFYKID